MKLYDKFGIEVAETIFDLKYKLYIEKHKWHLSNQGYVTCKYYDENNIQHNIRLHQAIIQMSGQVVPEGYEIDHKDTNSLNNLEINLRVCTHTQNIQNIKSYKHNTSGYKGVSWYKKYSKWESYIYINSKQTHIGYFNTFKDAAKAYNEAAIKYHGEFAQLNNV